MLQHKKGFTLIEVLVVMLIATLIFTMVGGTMVFVTSATSELIHQSEEIDMAKNIEKYLRRLDCTNLTNIKFDSNTRNIILGEEVVFAGTRLVMFNITENNNFIRCYMKFESGRQFDFIIGTVQREDDQ